MGVFMVMGEIAGFALPAFGDIYFLGSMVRESEKKAHDAIGV
jgi:hypothetical protein